VSTSQLLATVLATNSIVVKPHGKLPWFITASHSLASSFGRDSSGKQDAASTKSSESQKHFRDGSKGSDQELETVVVAAPRDEKVLRKF
jgi:AGZA family xanthine/uracil permease-like MFS transporter